MSEVGAGERRAQQAVQFLVEHRGGAGQASGGFPYTVSLDPSPQTPPEESLGAVTASLTVRSW